MGAGGPWNFNGHRIIKSGSWYYTPDWHSCQLTGMIFLELKAERGKTGRFSAFLMVVDGVF
jgi:hypothetical protein